MTRSKKGVVDILAVLLALAFTVALSSIFVQVSHVLYVSTTQSLPSGTVSVHGNVITIHNPYPLSVKLSKLKVFINDKPIPLSVKGGSDTWGPYEDLIVKIPTNESILSIKVFYGSTLIYSGVYIKPSLVKIDKRFPSLNATLDISNSGTVLVKVNASDDTMVKSLNIYFGTLNGTLISHLSIIPGVHPMWHEINHVKCNCIPKWSKNFRHVSLTLDYYPWESGNSVKFILIKATDCKGHVSQKVLFLKEVGPTISWGSISVLSKFAKVTNKKIISASPIANVDFHFTVHRGSTNIKSIEYEIDTGKWTNVSFNRNSSDVYISVPTKLLGYGTHKITVRVTDASGITTKSSLTISLIKDSGPLIDILYPHDDEVFSTTGNSAEILIGVRIISLNSIGISDVRATLDGVAIQLAHTSGNLWSATISAPVGVHTLSVSARDNLGATNTSSVTFTVFYSPVPILVPTGSSTTPIANSNNNSAYTPTYSNKPNIVAVAVPPIHWSVNFSKVGGNFVPTIGGGVKP